MTVTLFERHSIFKDSIIQILLFFKFSMIFDNLKKKSSSMRNPTNLNSFAEAAVRISGDKLYTRSQKNSWWHHLYLCFHKIHKFLTLTYEKNQEMFLFEFKKMSLKYSTKKNRQKKAISENMF
jgi:hypothetical protein